MVRELYAGVDLPTLVQRMLVVMHEVRAAAVVLATFRPRALAQGLAGKIPLARPLYLVVDFVL